MLRFKRRFAQILVFALFASACTGVVAGDEDIVDCPPGQSWGIVQCAYAEDFTAVDWDGNEVSLSSFRDRPVFLNFWASWCGPCRSEMPWIEQFYQEHKDEIYVLAIVHQEDEQSAREYFASQDYSFTFLFFDEETIGNRYMVAGIPQTLFLAPGGNIAGFARGAVQWTSDECQSVVNAFLELSSDQAISRQLIAACR